MESWSEHGELIREFLQKLHKARISIGQVEGRLTAELVAISLEEGFLLNTGTRKVFSTRIVATSVPARSARNCMRGCNGSPADGECPILPGNYRNRYSLVKPLKRSLRGNVPEPLRRRTVLYSRKVRHDAPRVFQAEQRQGPDALALDYRVATQSRLFPSPRTR
jgi:hypothetical protein